MPSTRAVMSLEQYLEEILTLVPAPVGTERVELASAHGRVLAEAVRSSVAVPAFANSAMDGYAVRWTDVDPVRTSAQAVTLNVVGDVPAGSGDDPSLCAGECVRIMTGAPVPTDADTVVPLELTDGGTTRVTIVEPPPGAAGAYVRHPGEDLAPGALVLDAGTLLSPAAIGALSGAGVGEVTVRRRPVVAVIATGDELVPAGRPLGRGQIHDATSLALAALAADAGCSVVTGPTVPDDEQAFAARLTELASTVDLVVVTGGVSVGDHDVARIVLGDGGNGVFRHVLMQPGKPQGYATWAGTPVIAVPGNPTSAAVSWHVFVRAAIAALLGLAPPSWGRAVAAAPWASPAGRRQLVPVVTSSGTGGEVLARPAHERGSASHLVTSLARADGLVAVPEDVTHVQTGTVLPLLRIR